MIKSLTSANDPITEYLERLGCGEADKGARLRRNAAIFSQCEWELVRRQPASTPRAVRNEIGPTVLL